MSSHSRCDGWAQCPLCPRPDNPCVPPQRGNPRCAPRPRHRCPTTGVHCHQNKVCCTQLLSCGGECLEFLPSPCSTMSAINCTPNLPPSGWSVLGWRPGPPAMRTCPRTQYPTSTCTKAPPPDLPCPRPCEARYLKSPARPRTIRYVPDQPWPISQPPCNPPPPVPPYTCRAIGSRRLTEHIQFKYSYPGYEDTPSGRHVLCKPCVECYERTAYWNSGCSRKPVSFYMAAVPEPDS